jgi:phage tail-like protein
MNVNGSRFELLLGRADWGRCRDGDADGARTLDAAWRGELASPPVDPGPMLPAWEPARNEVILRPRLIELPATPAEQPFSLDSRRTASADRNGNVYRIGDDRATLVVFSAGSRRESVFWPGSPTDCLDEPERWRRDFQPSPTPPAAETDLFQALAVTEDDYLVVAFARGIQRGFLAFDLVAGGPPVPTAWPDAVPLDAFDMAPRHSGGVWVLDRDRRRLWELDCRLAVVAAAQPSQTLVAGELDDFQPLTGAVRERGPAVFPAGIDLAGSPDGVVVTAIAVEVLGEDSVLLLDIDEAAKRSRVVRLRRTEGAWLAHASRWLDETPELAHDFVLGHAHFFQAGDAGPLLFIVTRAGNQARAFAVIDGPDAFDLTGSTDLFPLRRFGGRALVAIKGDGHYDSGVATVVWTPIVQQPRALYEPRAQFVTPVFDSFDVATTWDRIVLDACLPPDTAVTIESRAGDEFEVVLEGSPPAFVAAQVIGAWVPEPAPILRSNGPELPFLRSEAARATRRANGVGAWDLLLQNARGRYLQLRITLTSANGTATPRLRALRAWSPRLSYPQRFLPAVYREDPTSGPFLERWLANLENTLTGIEDHVVNVQSLFDARVAPAETLAWLATWFDVAFDPAWDGRRQRLFVKRAMDYFRWRGTVHGLRLALELAFDPCIEEAAFDDPVAGASAVRGIRIVETYQTRLVGALAAGDPGSTEPRPRIVKRGAMWSPAEGNAGLVDRFAAFLGTTATFAQELAPFPLVPPIDDSAGRWAAFMRTTMGFVPSIGAAERARWRNFLAVRGVAPDGVTLPRDFPEAQPDRDRWLEFSKIRDPAGMRTRWQDFLARRYRSIGRLQRAWQARWPSFDVVPPPDVLPETAAAQSDWRQFEGQVLAMHRTAHRFSVLLPLEDVTADPAELERRLGLARRIVDLEKPAHTVFDVRFYWAFFRVGEARLGLDTQMGSGSRARELIPEAILGRAYVGSSFVGGAAPPKDRDRLLAAC